MKPGAIEISTGLARKMKGEGPRCGFFRARLKGAGGYRGVGKGASR